jgi:hypothetical protein
VRAPCHGERRTRHGARCRASQLAGHGPRRRAAALPHRNRLLRLLVVPPPRACMRAAPLAGCGAPTPPPCQWQSLPVSRTPGKPRSSLMRATFWTVAELATVPWSSGRLTRTVDTPPPPRAHPASLFSACRRHGRHALPTVGGHCRFRPLEAIAGVDGEIPST